MPELDTQQRRALESGGKTVVVTGAPGSGKTHLLAKRLEFLVKSRGVPLSSILVFTFSSAAAARLRRTVERMIQESYDELHIHTYHSFAARILTDHVVAGANSAAPPKPVTPFREYLVVRELLQSQQPRFRSYLKIVASGDGLAREMTDFFGRLRQNLISPAEFEKIAANISAALHDIARMYSAHAAYMEKKNWVGPGDAVVRAIEILDSEPEFLAEYRRRFPHILADEFQELDPSQLHLIGLLASEETSLFVTGDEDQRIYRFRGSTADQFTEIEKTRPGTETISLDGSHRLRPELLKASQNLIAHNHDQEAETRPISRSEELEIARYSDTIEQAYGVARDIKRRVLDSADHENPLNCSDFAVICRSTSRSAHAIEEAFSYYDIPYVLYNSTSFYKHPMARSVAAFVRLLIDPSSDSSLLRVLSIPAFGVDAIQLSKLVSAATRPGGESLFDVLKKAAKNSDASREAAGEAEKMLVALRKFFDYFEAVRKRALDTDCPSAIVHSVMADLFFGGLLSDRDVSAGTRDARNLRLLYEVASDIEGVLAGMRGRCTLADVAEHMEHAFVHFSSQAENDPAEEHAEGVRIMTVHQAKGMQFPFVYLIDMTEEYFPRLGRSAAMLDGKSLGRLTKALERHAKTRPGYIRIPQLALSLDEQLREERRLVYVAVTRACLSLTICFTDESNISEPVQPSPFIDELIGIPVEVFLTQSGRAPAERPGAQPFLVSSLNKQELESALRECMRKAPSGGGPAGGLPGFFESLGLDAGFICDESPFGGEPRRALDLSAHVYSASQLSTYLTCPRKFYYEKILRIASERPEDFGLGQLVHNALEIFHEKVSHFDEDPKALQARLDEAFLRVWNGEGYGRHAKEAFRNRYGTALQRATIKRRATNILRRYIRTETKEAPEREVIACEERIEFEVRGYAFVAKIDRIDSAPEGYHIIDYKTSADGWMQAKTIKKKFLNIEGAPDYRPVDFQLPLYLLASRSAGYNPVELAYYWLAQENSKGMFKKGSLGVGEGAPELLSAEEICAVEDSIVEVVGQVAAGDFEPRPKSPFECRRCSFEMVCRFGENETDAD